jgi:hypothetical protein
MTVLGCSDRFGCSDGFGCTISFKARGILFCKELSPQPEKGASDLSDHHPLAECLTTTYKKISLVVRILESGSQDSGVLSVLPS